MPAAGCSGRGQPSAARRPACRWSSPRRDRAAVRPCRPFLIGAVAGRRMRLASDDPEAGDRPPMPAAGCSGRGRPSAARRPACRRSPPRRDRAKGEAVPLASDRRRGRAADASCFDDPEVGDRPPMPAAGCSGRGRPSAARRPACRRSPPRRDRAEARPCRSLLIGAAAGRQMRLASTIPRPAIGRRCRPPVAPAVAGHRLLADRPADAHHHAGTAPKARPCRSLLIGAAAGRQMRLALTIPRSAIRRRCRPPVAPAVAGHRLLADRPADAHHHAGTAPKARPCRSLLIGAAAGRQMRLASGLGTFPGSPWSDVAHREAPRLGPPRRPDHRSGMFLTCCMQSWHCYTSTCRGSRFD
jgi:hypothetical protein